MKEEELQGKVDFILVDDEDINNLIGRFTVQMVLGKESLTESFTRPEAALDRLKDFTPRSPDVATVLLLDINMPVMTGWEFLERFDNLDQAIKNNICVHILSSSVDERDKERSYANKNVMSFIVKPLTKESVLEISKGCMKG